MVQNDINQWRMLNIWVVQLKGWVSSMWMCRMKLIGMATRNSMTIESF
jgi:hypothetical protein